MQQLLSWKSICRLSPHTYLSLFFHPILKWKCAAVSNQTIPAIIFAEVWACTFCCPRQRLDVAVPAQFPARRATWGLWELWLCLGSGKAQSCVLLGLLQTPGTKKAKCLSQWGSEHSPEWFPSLQWVVSLMSEAQGFSMALTTCSRFHPAALWKLLCLMIFAGPLQWM